MGIQNKGWLYATGITDPPEEPETRATKTKKGADTKTGAKSAGTTKDADSRTAAKAPTEDSTKDEIKAYLDKQGIEYKSGDTKDELLARVEG